VYQAALGRLAPEAYVLARACPMFVPLAEEGWLEGPIPTQVAETYLTDLRKIEIDSLLLACTHYPVLLNTIQKVVGPEVTIVDSADATAETVAGALERLGLRNATGGRGTLLSLVSDAPERFAETGRAFLGESIGKVEWVDL
jgi:glutamate racemase